MKEGYLSDLQSLPTWTEFGYDLPHDRRSSMDGGEGILGNVEVVLNPQVLEFVGIFHSWVLLEGLLEYKYVDVVYFVVLLEVGGHSFVFVGSLIYLFEGRCLDWGDLKVYICINKVGER